ncbi:phage tail tape measure protein [Deinococcus hopiensis]|uniref:phage tail tape measure protein n=1 Tax=Deinococcus hopiensis TaxID=309885 RepID=UPI0014839680|nr:phage tail tape measure protein [Deinococcus hopiensis]
MRLEDNALPNIRAQLAKLDQNTTLTVKLRAEGSDQATKSVKEALKQTEQAASDMQRQVSSMFKEAGSSARASAESIKQAWREQAEEGKRTAREQAAAQQIQLSVARALGTEVNELRRQWRAGKIDADQLEAGMRPLVVRAEQQKAAFRALGLEVDHNRKVFEAYGVAADRAVNTVNTAQGRMTPGGFSAGIAQGLNSSLSQFGLAGDLIGGLAQLIAAKRAASANAAQDLGRSTFEGLVQGMKSEQVTVKRVATDTANSVEAAVKAELDIHSPSRVMDYLGKMSGAGFASGIRSQGDEARAAAKSLADAAQAGVSGTRLNVAGAGISGGGIGGSLAGVGAGVLSEALDAGRLTGTSQALGDLNKQLKENAKASQDAATAGASTEVATEALGGAVEGAAEQVQAFTEARREGDEEARQQALNEAKTALAFTAVAAGVTAVTAALVVNFNAAADYEAAMSKAGATTQATAGQMEQLKTATQSNDLVKLGIDATTAAGGVEELGGAGLSTAQIVGGGLISSLTLAKAVSTDVATAASVAAASVKAFGLDAKDLAKVADIVTNAVNGTSIKIDNFTDAIAAGGSTAKSQGVNLLTFTAAVSLMTDKAIGAADAGTSLKTFLMSLTPNSKEATAALHDLGFSAFDAQGNFKPLGQVIGELREKFAKLTPEQRAMTAETVFGSDGIRAFNILVDAGSQGLEERIRLLDENGSATKAAGDKLNGTRGAQEQFNAALKNFEITAGQSFLPTAAKMLNWSTSFLQNLQSINKEYGALAHNKPAFGAETFNLGIWLNQVGLRKADLTPEEVKAAREILGHMQYAANVGAKNAEQWRKLGRNDVADARDRTTAQEIGRLGVMLTEIQREASTRARPIGPQKDGTGAAVRVEIVDGKNLVDLLGMSGRKVLNDFGVSGKDYHHDGAVRADAVHNGIDYAAPRGAPILAPFSGTLSVRENKTSGKIFELMDAAGNKLVGIHLDQFDAGILRALEEGGKKAITIGQGTRIGGVGNSGTTAGSATHLHLMGYQKGDTKPRNPTSIQYQGIDSPAWGVNGASALPGAAPLIPEKTWQQYEKEARRLVALVEKYAPGGAAPSGEEWGKASVNLDKFRDSSTMAGQAVAYVQLETKKAGQEASKLGADYDQLKGKLNIAESLDDAKRPASEVIGILEKVRTSAQAAADAEKRLHGETDRYTGLLNLVGEATKRVDQIRSRKPEQTELQRDQAVQRERVAMEGLEKSIRSAGKARLESIVQGGVTAEVSLAKWEAARKELERRADLEKNPKLSNLDREQQAQREAAAQEKLEKSIRGASAARLKDIVAAGVQQVGDLARWKAADAELKRREGLQQTADRQRKTNQQEANQQELALALALREGRVKDAERLVSELKRLQGEELDAAGENLTQRQRIVEQRGTAIVNAEKTLAARSRNAAIEAARVWAEGEDTKAKATLKGQALQDRLAEIERLRVDKVHDAYADEAEAVARSESTQTQAVTKGHADRSKVLEGLVQKYADARRELAKRVDTGTLTAQDMVEYARTLAGYWKEAGKAGMTARPEIQAAHSAAVAFGTTARRTSDHLAALNQNLESSGAANKAAAEGVSDLADELVKAGDPLTALQMLETTLDDLMDAAARGESVGEGISIVQAKIKKIKEDMSEEDVATMQAWLKTYRDIQNAVQGNETSFDQGNEEVKTQQGQETQIRKLFQGGPKDVAQFLLGTDGKTFAESFWFDFSEKSQQEFMQRLNGLDNEQLAGLGTDMLQRLLDGMGDDEAWDDWRTRITQTLKGLKQDVLDTQGKLFEGLADDAIQTARDLAETGDYGAAFDWLNSTRADMEELGAAGANAGGGVLKLAAAITELKKQRDALAGDAAARAAWTELTGAQRRGEAVDVPTSGPIASTGPRPKVKDPYHPEPEPEGEPGRRTDPVLKADRGYARGDSPEKQQARDSIAATKAMDVYRISLEAMTLSQLQAAEATAAANGNVEKQKLLAAQIAKVLDEEGKKADAQLALGLLDQSLTDQVTAVLKLTDAYQAGTLGAKDYTEQAFALVDILERQAKAAEAAHHPEAAAAFREQAALLRDLVPPAAAAAYSQEKLRAASDEMATAQGKTKAPFADTIKSLEALRGAAGLDQKALEGLIAKFKELSRQEATKQELAKLGSEFDKLAGYIDHAGSIFRKFTDDQANYASIATDYISMNLKATSQAMQGDIAGAVFTSIEGILNIGENIASLSPGLKAWKKGLLEVAEAEKKVAQESVGMFKNPYATALNQDAINRQKLADSRWYQRLGWDLFGGAPQVLEDEAAKLKTRAAEIFNDLAGTISNTFTSALMDAFGSGDWTGVQKAMDKSLNEFVAHAAIEAMVKASKLQDLIKAYADARAAGGDGASQLAALRLELGRLRAEARGVLSGLPGYGEGLAEKARNDAEKALDLQYKAGLLSTAKYEGEKLKITLARIKAELEAELAVSGLTEEEKAKIRARYNLEGLAAQAEFDRAEAERARTLASTQADVAQAALEGQYRNGTVLTQAYQAQLLQMTLDRLKREKETALAVAGLTAEEIAAINAKFSQQEADAKNKQRDELLGNWADAAGRGLLDGLKNGDLSGFGANLQKQVFESTVTGLVMGLASDIVRAELKPLADSVAAAFLTPDKADDLLALGNLKGGFELALPQLMDLGQTFLPFFQQFGFVKEALDKNAAATEKNTTATQQNSEQLATKLDVIVTQVGLPSGLSLAGSGNAYTDGFD